MPLEPLLQHCRRLAGCVLPAGDHRLAAERLELSRRLRLEATSGRPVSPVGGHKFRYLLFGCLDDDAGSVASCCLLPVAGLLLTGRFGDALRDARYVFIGADARRWVGGCWVEGGFRIEVGQLGHLLAVQNISGTKVIRAAKLRTYTGIV